PEPLDDGGLQKSSRRIGVELQELGRAGAVIEEIESAIDGVFILVPTSANIVHKGRRHLELLPQSLASDALRRLETKIVERVGGLLEDVDLARGKQVMGRLVPVRAAVVGSVENKSLLFDAALPVGTRRAGHALHAQPPTEGALWPNPPRGLEAP